MTDSYKMQQPHVNYNTSAMESGDHLKNGASLKNQMRCKRIKYLQMVLLYLFVINVYGQTTVSFTWRIDNNEQEINNFIGALQGTTVWIDWGDGTPYDAITGSSTSINLIASGVVPNIVWGNWVSHIYSLADTYQVTIYGEYENANPLITLLLNLNSNWLNNQSLGVHLTQIDITNASYLRSLFVAARLNNNKGEINQLDVSHNTQLEWLECSGNQLYELDFTYNTNLLWLSCNYNNLTSLYVSNNTELVWLECETNQLTQLDISNNTELAYLNCAANQLTQLDVSNNTELAYLNCGYNQLITLDVSNSLELVELFCYLNQLTQLNISNNTELVYLEFYNNQLTQLDLSNNTELFHLGCSSNQLTSLDLSNNTKLEQLNCDGNHLTNLDISGLPPLWDFNGSNQQVNLTLSNSGSGVYTLPIVLNNPTFTNSNITYASGNLQSGNNATYFTGFTTETGNSSFQLSGSMHFTYSECSPTEYTITATAGANGSISPSGAVCVAGGENQTFTFTPNSCFEIDKVLVDGIPVSITDGAFTFENIVSNHTIHATFALTMQVPLVEINGPNIVCENDSSVTLYAIISPVGTNVTYQWYLNGVAIEGATADILSIAHLESTSYPYIFVIQVTDIEFGCVILSMPHFIYVNQFPIISIMADKIEISAGEMVKLTAEVSGEPNMIYQWCANGVAIPGATATIYYANPIITTTFTFTATQSGSECVAYSNAVTVTVVTSISGKVFRPNQTTLSSGEVSLYRVQTLSQFILVEMVQIDTDGTYKFTNVAQGGYIVKTIAPTEENALPTYYGNSENWEQAQLITVSTASVSNVDITIISVPEIEEGDSEINGYVVEENDKKTRTPVEDATVYLLLFKNNVWITVATTNTDAKGGFVFSKLSAGKYMSIVDAPGIKMLNNIPLDLAVTDTINIVFTITDEGIKTTLGTVGVLTQRMPEIKIYPNPTTGELRIESGELRINTVEIFDVFGRSVGINTQVRPENSGSEIVINISHLSVGVYFLKINTEIGQVIKKVLKE